MNINPVNIDPKDHNRFCGPAAISILTGMTTGSAARLLRHVTGKDRIMGTHHFHVRAALQACGVTMSRRFLAHYGFNDPNAKNPTLTQWLKASQTSRTTGRVYLVSAGNHWIIITGRRYCCGLTKGIISIRDKQAKRRARVDGVWEITTEKVSIPADKIAPIVRPKRRVDPHYGYLKALERQHGFKGRLDHDCDPPDYTVEPCERFPRGLATCHYDWMETWSRVEECLENPILIDDEGYFGR